MSALTCDCRAELEAKLAERFKEQKPEASDHKVSIGGYGFGIKEDGSVAMLGMLPYSATAMFPLKSGGTKSKTTEGNMVFSYCPFCGTKGDA